MGGGGGEYYTKETSVTWGATSRHLAVRGRGDTYQRGRSKGLSLINWGGEQGANESGCDSWGGSATR